MMQEHLGKAAFVTFIICALIAPNAFGNSTESAFVQKLSVDSNKVSDRQGWISISNEARQSAVRYGAEGKLDRAKSMTEKGTITFSRDSGVTDFRYRTLIGHQVATIYFSGPDKEKKLYLREVNLEEVRPHFAASGDDGPFGDIASAPALQATPLKCDGPLQSQATSLAVATNSALTIPKIQGCNADQASRVRDMIATLLQPNRVSQQLPFSCQSKFLGDADSKNLSSRLTGLSKLNLVCSASEKSQFLDPNTITIGKEILRSSKNAGKAFLYHELLHSIGVTSEQETRSIVDCCGDEKLSKPNGCRLAAMYKLAAQSKLVPFVERFERDILESVRLSLDKKEKILNSIDAARTQIKCDGKVPDKKAIAKFSSLLDLTCKESMESANCTDVGKLFASSDLDTVCSVAGTAAFLESSSIFNASFVADTVGATKVDPDAKVGEPAAIPQKLTYSVSDKNIVDSKEIRRYDTAMSAVGRSAYGIGQRIMSAAGMTAYASTPTLPRKNSDGSFSTELIGMKDGKPLIAIGNDLAVTATLSEPFSDQPVRSDMKFYNAKTGAPLNQAQLANFSESGSGPASASKITQTKKSATSNGEAPALGESGASSEASLSSSATIGSGKAPANSGVQDEPRSSRQPSTAYPNTSSQNTVSRTDLKRIFVRAADPVQAINSHIDDLRNNSMMVQYMCNWYPSNFQGSPIERFSIDAMQGRSCGTGVHR